MKRTMLVVGMVIALAMSTLAIAAAEDPGDEPGAAITAPGDGQIVVGTELTLEASTTTPSTPISWAVRSGDKSNNPRCLASGNTEYRFDGNFSTSSTNGHFTETLAIGALPEHDVPGSGEFCFVFNADPGQGTSAGPNRAVHHFTISDDPLAEFKNVADCEAGQTCSVSVEGLSATTTGQNGARIGLRNSFEPDDATVAAVNAACESAVAGVNPTARLGQNLVQLIPLGFEGGEIVVTSTILRDEVDSGRARGAGIFQVCFAGEKPEFGDEIDTTGLYGPTILERCARTRNVAPCVISKTKVEGDVVLTYKIPAEDPWMR